MGFASIVGGLIISDSLLMEASVFTGELYAMMEALNIILSQGIESSRYTILSDLQIAQILLLNQWP